MPCRRDRRFGCFSGFLLPVGELLGRDAFKQRLYERACSVALGVVTLGHEARFGRVNDVVALDVGQREAVTLLREVGAVASSLVLTSSKMTARPYHLPKLAVPRILFCTIR